MEYRSALCQGFTSSFGKNTLSAWNPKTRRVEYCLRNTLKMKVHYSTSKIQQVLKCIKYIFLISYKGIASSTYAFCMDLSGSNSSQIP